MKYSTNEIESFVARFYPNRNLLITPFAYVATFLAFAQATQQSQVLTIAANADFVLLGIQHRANIGAVQTVSSKNAPFVRMLVTDSGSNEQFTDSEIDLETYSTNGAFDNPLPYPRIIAGRTSLTIAVSNFSPDATAYTSLDIVFEGVLVRAYQPRG